MTFGRWCDAWRVLRNNQISSLLYGSGETLVQLKLFSDIREINSAFPAADGYGDTVSERVRDDIQIISLEEIDHDRQAFRIHSPVLLYPGPLVLSGFDQDILGPGGRGEDFNDKIRCSAEPFPLS